MSVINPSSHWQVVIVGGGNAALCAAIEAAEQNKRVLLLEAAPKEYRGGNSRHTRNFRCMHKGPLSRLTDSYLEDEYLEDLLAVTKGKTDRNLATLAIQQSEQCLPWMEAQGVRFQPSLTGTLSLSRTNAFFLGGGKALLNAYYQTAEKLGVTVLYNAPVKQLNLDESKSRMQSVDVDLSGKLERITGDCFVLASGGFQADIEWLARAWGPAARNFLIRGTSYNKGVVLKNMLDQGASSVGDPTQCHAVAIDGRAPQYDGGIVTRLDCVPFSVVVNKNGERFYDEGEDVWPKRYAIWGRLVAAQPDQFAFSIIDDSSIPLFMPSVYPPVTADTLEELAALLDLPVEDTVKTIEQYNAACQSGEFQATALDGLSTTGITPATFKTTMVPMRTCGLQES